MNTKAEATPLKKSRWIIILFAVAAVGLLGGAIVERLGILPTGEEYRLGSAFLTGSTAFPAANGSAPFEMGLGGDYKTFQLELKGVPELARTKLDVFVDEIKAGIIDIDSEGNGKMMIETRANDKSVPKVEKASLVEVKTAGGLLVASGQY